MAIPSSDFGKKIKNLEWEFIILRMDQGILENLTIIYQKDMELQFNQMEAPTLEIYKEALLVDLEYHWNKMETNMLESG